MKVFTSYYVTLCPTWKGFVVWTQLLSLLKCQTPALKLLDKQGESSAKDEDLL